MMVSAFFILVGLQGKIDATLRIERRNHGGVVYDRDVIVPLELKTGKPYVSDTAQLALYTLLIGTRYGETAAAGQGLLLYVTQQSVSMNGEADDMARWR